jgi:hypothetical protein
MDFLLCLCVGLCLNVHTMYEIMFGVWEVSPYWLLDEWSCSVDFLQVRRVERAAETKRNFCFWLSLGLPRHAHWRGNVCLPRHPLGRDSPGQHGCRMSTITQDCRATLYGAAKRPCRAMTPSAVALPYRV